ncbi:hypothetical protein [Trinickia dinghuensis]|uniref:hypothetical protein n=1 Tax=Trinickia dinghuensis TaxID=2291023 RepID=UPI001C69886B|nr:hypothetical protein [Trinickia dinghuensis]
MFNKSPSVPAGLRRPHIGEKEQTRAKRGFMEPKHPSGTPRSAPILQQRAKV